YNCLPRIQLLAQFFADIVGIPISHWNGVNMKVRRFPWLGGVRLMEFTSHRKREPLYGRGCATPHTKDGIFLIEDAADGRRRVDAKSLKLTEMQKSGDAIDVGTGEKDIVNRRGVMRG